MAAVAWYSSWFYPARSTTTHQADAFQASWSPTSTRPSPRRHPSAQLLARARIVDLAAPEDRLARMPGDQLRSEAVALFWRSCRDRNECLAQWTFDSYVVWPSIPRRACLCRGIAAQRQAATGPAIGLQSTSCCASARANSKTDAGPAPGSHGDRVPAFAPLFPGAVQECRGLAESVTTRRWQLLLPQPHRDRRSIRFNTQHGQGQMVAAI